MTMPQVLLVVAETLVLALLVLLVRRWLRVRRAAYQRLERQLGERLETEERARLSRWEIVIPPPSHDEALAQARARLRDLTSFLVGCFASSGD